MEKPTNLSTIERIRLLSTNKQDAHVDGVLIDFMTARTIIEAYDKMSEPKQKKFEQLKVRHMATVAFKQSE